MERHSVISRSCRIFLTQAINESYTFFYLPFKITTKSPKLERERYVTGRTKRSRFQNSATIIPALFLFCRLIHWRLCIFDESAKSAQYGIVMLYGFLTFLLTSVVCYHAQQYSWEHFNFLRMTLGFFASIHCGSNLKKRGTEVKNGCELYLRTMRIGLRLTVLAFTFILIVKPERPTTFMSAWKTPKKEPFYIPVTILNVQSVFSVLMGLQYFSALNVIYIFAMDNTMRRTGSTVEGGRISADAFKKFWRSAQLLQTFYNDLFGTWLLPAQEYIIVVLGVVGMYGMVVMQGTRVIYFSINLSVLSHLSFLYRRMGKLHENSAELLEKAVEKYGMIEEERKGFQRFRRSCRPISVMHGHMFYVDKQLIVTIWQVLVVNSINLLVTLR